VADRHRIFADFSGKASGASICAVTTAVGGNIEGVFRLLPPMTSSQGEFLALLLSLQLARKRRWKRVVVLSDNHGAVAAARKESVPESSPFALYHQTLQVLKGKFSDVKFEAITGDRNVAHPYSQITGQSFQLLAGFISLQRMLAEGESGNRRGGHRADL